jgi:hypothetical protein
MVVVEVDVDELVPECRCSIAASMSSVLKVT